MKIVTHTIVKKQSGKITTRSSKYTGKNRKQIRDQFETKSPSYRTHCPKRILQRVFFAFFLLLLVESRGSWEIGTCIKSHRLISEEIVVWSFECERNLTSTRKKIEYHEYPPLLIRFSTFRPKSHISWSVTISWCSPTLKISVNVMNQHTWKSWSRKKPKYIDHATTVRWQIVSVGMKWWTWHYVINLRKSRTSKETSCSQDK